MEKNQQTLREWVFAIYRKVYKTDKTPGMLELAQLFNALGHGLFCSDARKELGDDLYELVKRTVKVKKRGTSVNITEIVKAIGGLR